MTEPVVVRIERAVAHDFVRRTLVSQLRFYFPAITQVRFDDTGVEVTAGAEVPRDGLIRAVERIVGRFAGIPARIPRRVVHDSARAAAAPAIADRLVHWTHFRSAMTDLGHRIRSYDESTAARPARTRQVRPGLNVYGQRDSFLLRAVDEALRAYVSAAYGAVELTVPSMISSETVDRAGYFESGCQHLSFVAPISNDPDVFDEFLSYWRGGPAGGRADLHRFLKTPRDVLNPALCLHTFPLYENAQLPAGRVDAITVTGSCFRDESGNLNNAERLNEFRMREAVFFGEPQALDRVHAELVGALIALGSLLGWSFRVETASDMFFNENADRQLLSQLLSDNKLELLIDLPSVGKEVACASINRHHSHFATAFGIRERDDRYAASMCVGFGLDRLLLAMVDQLDAGMADFGDRLLGRLAAIQPAGATVAAGT